jgi:drug/metabolite transporter (DMT)-like permease
MLAMTGVFIVLLPTSSINLSSVLSQSLSFADVLAIVGGFTFALTQVLLKRMGDTPKEGRLFAMFAGGAILAALAGALGIAQGWVSALPEASFYWLSVAALLSIAFMVGNAALQYAAPRLPANTTAVVMLTEIIFGSLSAVWLGAAMLDAKTLIGGSLIFVAAALATRQN